MTAVKINMNVESNGNISKSTSHKTSETSKETYSKEKEENINTVRNIIDVSSDGGNFLRE
jgi:hypothetical protein